MKAENITKSPSGYIKCTLNGIKIEGLEDQVNVILHANGYEPLEFEPQHWSSTKHCLINIKDMAAKHIENHLFNQYGSVDMEDIIDSLKYNSGNFRDYLRRLITVYDNYKK